MDNLTSRKIMNVVDLNIVHAPAKFIIEAKKLKRASSNNKWLNVPAGAVLDTVGPGAKDF